MSQKARLVFGCMTGTSLDGLDTVLAEIAGRGLRMRVTIRDRRSARRSAALHGNNTHILGQHIMLCPLRWMRQRLKH